MCSFLGNECQLVGYSLLTVDSRIKKDRWGWFQTKPRVVELRTIVVLSEV